ncbi:hypothetical protein ABB27_15895 [Stenotrophomonas terrae]|uniref:Uncharacterized protein n=1 Tax=Stenotrophomonas terrae TaxID=405446 RepID=A0A0R0C6H1_9GAMM|nr:hypothetical protein ABB27_15895 [Stenotrophomonas terrae]
MYLQPVLANPTICPDLLDHYQYRPALERRSDILQQRQCSSVIHKIAEHDIDNCRIEALRPYRKFAPVGEDKQSILGPAPRLRVTQQPE